MLMVVVCVFLSCDFSNIKFSHKSIFSDGGLLRASAEQLSATVIPPHLEEPIQSGRNVLWCSAFQLVWNEVCELIGEDVHFYEDPPMVPILNKKTARKSDIDDASYVALAGFIRDGILQRIRSELNKKFKGRAYPRLIPSREGLRPQDIVGYAYLFKNLEFPQRFERLEKAISFANTRVACFGIGEGFKSGHLNMYEQVSILSYENRDDFVIELKTKSEADQVILAKVAPAETLGGTIAQITDCISQATSTEMQTGDILKVPKFNFDLHRKYKELLGRNLKVRNPDIAKDLLVLAAEQLIRFQMDEKGVRLRSESSKTFGCSAPSSPRPQHIMIFDKPFLIMLKRRDAQRPYFALWVDNPELLVQQ